MGKLLLPKESQKDNKAINTTKSHDKIFLKLLQKKSREMNPERTLKTMKSIKESQIVVSKQILSKVLESFAEKYKQQGSQALNIFNRKETLQKPCFTGGITSQFLKSCQQKALRQLVKEEFNLQSSKEISNLKTFDETEQFLVLLFQKELLLENLLTILE